MNIIEKELFRTNAIKVSDENNPFWYTSGTIGPYFINTHFLFGGESISNEILSFIDNNIDNKEKLINELIIKIVDFYNKNYSFKQIIDFFYDIIKDNQKFQISDYISGGERRDWFFSIIISYLSKKNHIFIFKDLTAYNEKGIIKDLNNKNVSHIADLITEASSYKRSWIPAIKNINGNLLFSAAIVDRMQGGKEYLLNQNIEVVCAVSINDTFFQEALKNNIINQKQLDSIKKFNLDPVKYGKDFFNNNKQFLLNSLNSNDKSIKIKAERCIKDNIYNIDINF